MTTTFENACINDMVWSFMYGWGVIIKIHFPDQFPIKVHFNSGMKETYTLTGRHSIKATQSLFWREIKINPPSMPSKTKYKNINGFKVPKVIIELPDIPKNIKIVIPTFHNSYLWTRICLYNDIKHLERLIECGLAYPDTEEGINAAIIHGNALLGEGEPWVVEHNLVFKDRRRNKDSN